MAGKCAGLRGDKQADPEFNKGRADNGRLAATERASDPAEIHITSLDARVLNPHLDHATLPEIRTQRSEGRRPTTGLLCCRDSASSTACGASARLLGSATTGADVTNDRPLNRAHAHFPTLRVISWVGPTSVVVLDNFRRWTDRSRGATVLLGACLLVAVCRLPQRCCCRGDERTGWRRLDARRDGLDGLEAAAAGMSGTI